VLVNLCADCHAKPSYTGTFKMACGTHDLDPALARQNLKAALGHIKKDEPGASPILVKALAMHGGMKQAAFANRNAPAYRVLEAWVHLAAGADSPAAPPIPDAKPALPAVPPPDVKPAVPPVPDAKPALPPVPPPALPGGSDFGADARPKPPMVPNPENKGDAVDEFDPSTFNRSTGAPKPGALPAVPPLPPVK
jgi:hypothetical protein